MFSIDCEGYLRLCPVGQTEMIPEFTYPARAKEYPMEHLHRENDRLIVILALVGYTASIRLTITDVYFSPGISKGVLDSLRTGSFLDPPQDTYERPFPREKEGLLQITQGKSSKGISVP